MARVTPQYHLLRMRLSTVHQKINQRAHTNFTTVGTSDQMSCVARGLQRQKRTAAYTEPKERDSFGAGWRPILRPTDGRTDRSTDRSTSPKIMKPEYSRNQNNCTGWGTLLLSLPSAAHQRTQVWRRLLTNILLRRAPRSDRHTVLLLSSQKNKTNIKSRAHDKKSKRSTLLSHGKWWQDGWFFFFGIFFKKKIVFTWF